MTTDPINTSAPPATIDLDAPAEQPAMGREDAKELTEEIRKSANKLWNLIARAYTGKAWLAMGYESWDAYCEAEFPDGRPWLPRDKRREVAQSLKDAGYSVRDIAAVTNTPKSTISDDLQVSENRTPEEVKPRRTSVEKAVDDLREAIDRIKWFAVNGCEPRNKYEIAGRVNDLSKSHDVLGSVIEKLKEQPE